MSTPLLIVIAAFVALGSAGLMFAGVRRLREHAPRWVPRLPAPTPAPAPAPTPAPTPTPTPAARVPRPAPPELAIVHLGATADPAWAAWGLKWEAPGHGEGFVPLPSGARVLLGRDPGADIVVRLDQVSWQHLELDVQEGRVIAFELGSSNGTRVSDAGEALPARTPWPWAPGATLHLASPVALKLVLEPLR